MLIFLSILLASGFFLLGSDLFESFLLLFFQLLAMQAFFPICCYLTLPRELVSVIVGLPDVRKKLYRSFLISVLINELSSSVLEDVRSVVWANIEIRIIAHPCHD